MENRREMGRDWIAYRNNYLPGFLLFFLGKVWLFYLDTWMFQSSPYSTSIPHKLLCFSKESNLITHTQSCTAALNLMLTCMPAPHILNSLGTFLRKRHCNEHPKEQSLDKSVRVLCVVLWIIWFARGAVVANSTIKWIDCTSTIRKLLSQPIG